MSDRILHTRRSLLGSGVVLAAASLLFARPDNAAAQSHDSDAGHSGGGRGRGGGHDGGSHDDGGHDDGGHDDGGHDDGGHSDGEGRRAKGPRYRGGRGLDGGAVTSRGHSLSDQVFQAPDG